MSQAVFKPLSALALKILFSLCILSRSFSQTDKSPDTHTDTHTYLLELWVDIVQVPLEGFTVELLPKFHSASDTEHRQKQTIRLIQKLADDQQTTFIKIIFLCHYHMGRKSNKATTQNKTDTSNDKLRVQPLPITEVCDMKTGKILKQSCSIIYMCRTDNH